MGEKWNLQKTKEILKNLFLHKDKMILLALSGILLLVICIPTKKSTYENKENKNLQQEAYLAEQYNDDKITEVINKQKQLDNYVTNLEDKLKEQLEQMDGVGEVSVMITLRKSEKQLIARESPDRSSVTQESDGSGGNRSITEQQREDTIIYQKWESGKEEPYSYQQEQPEIEGVMIVADGGDNGKIQFQITEAVQALFGIESHKIRIVKRKS